MGGVVMVINSTERGDQLVRTVQRCVVMVIKQCEYM